MNLKTIDASCVIQVCKVKAGFVFMPFDWHAGLGFDRHERYAFIAFGPAEFFLDW